MYEMLLKIMEVGSHSIDIQPIVDVWSLWWSSPHRIVDTHGKL